MSERPDFQRRQYAFAAHLREPDKCAAPEQVDDRRMEIYRKLFFNNLLNLLSNSFPVLCKIYSTEQWRRIVRQFMARHRARSPYFLEIPREFLGFLESEYELQNDDFPFLLELAHYEWSELAISVSDASNDGCDVHPGGDLLDGIPVLSVLAQPLSYTYPVHRISPEFIPVEPGADPTCLVIYRKDNGDVAFMQVNPVTSMLLERIRDNDGTQSGRELLLRLAEDIRYPDHAALLEHGRDAMESMRSAGILLGTRSP